MSAPLWTVVNASLPGSGLWPFQVAWLISLGAGVAALLSGFSATAATSFARRAR